MPGIKKSGRWRPENSSLRGFRALVPLIAAFFCFAGLAGCEATVSSNELVPSIPALPKTFKNSVHVIVAGTSLASYEALPSFDELTFGAAVERTLMNNNVFGSLRRNDPADYLLIVEITSMRCSSICEMTATWRLIANSDKKMVWEKEVRSSGRGPEELTTSDGQIRVIALENAGSENIRQAIEAMVREAPLPAQ